MCDVGSTEATWLADPRCTGCGGPWPPAAGVSAPQAIRLLPVEEEAPPLRTAALGIRPGSAVVVQDKNGRHGLIVLPGAPESGWSTASPVGNVKSAIPEPRSR
jgi:hypothetical protein